MKERGEGEGIFFNEGLTLVEAVSRVEYALREVAVTGAGDSEYEQLTHVLDRLKKGDLTPSQAVNKVNDLAGDRQDYH